MIRDFTSLDLETTGLNPKRDRIIEIGAVKIRNGEVTGRFETQVNPGRKLEERIVRLTKITDQQLLNAPYIDEVLSDLFDFIGDDILLGHRILFDYSFLKRAAVNQRIPFEKQGIDTLKIARKLLPELPGKKLTDLCSYYGIVYDAHRAASDALAAAMLYFKLAEQFPAIEEFSSETLVYKVKRESPVSPKQKERLYKLIEQHKLVVDYDIDKLTRNEADRIADKIISQYGRI